MERRGVVDGINASWRFLESCGLAESFASSEPLEVDEGFKEEIMSSSSTHESLYSFCLQRSYFNILLFDHSFFQYGWMKADHVRFAYYPNPHVSDLNALNNFRRYREMLADGIITDDDFGQLVRGMKFRGSVPIFRYENAPSQYVALSHPCSHLHIGLHGDNRWALRRQLTPLAFTMLIVKHYFSDEWSLGVEPGSTDGMNKFDTVLGEERSRCRVLSEFSSAEERTFHFF